MPLNSSDLLTDPIDTIMSTFTDILSSAFWLIPIGFIAVALYIKTKEVTAVSIWLLGSCLLVGSANLFGEYPQMAFVYYIFAVIGLVGTILSIWLMNN